MKKQCKKYASWIKNKETKENKKEKYGKHIVKKCNQYSDESDDENDEHQSTSEEAHVCLKAGTQELEREAWYLDSGSSAHMTSRREILSNFNPRVRGVVTAADGHQLKIEGAGNATLKSNRRNIDYSSEKGIVRPRARL